MSTCRSASPPFPTTISLSTFGGAALGVSGEAANAPSGYARAVAPPIPSNIRRVICSSFGIAPSLPAQQRHDLLRHRLGDNGASIMSLSPHRTQLFAVRDYENLVTF